MIQNVSLLIPSGIWGIKGATSGFDIFSSNKSFSSAQKQNNNCFRFFFVITLTMRTTQSIRYMTIKIVSLGQGVTELSKYDGRICIRWVK